MNWIDLSICILSLIAAIDGWRRGLISRAFALAGLVVGICGALAWGGRCAEVLGIGGEWAGAFGFAAVLVAAVLVFGWVGGVLRKVCGGIGLGVLDRAGGALLGAAEVLLLAGLLFRGADRFAPEPVPEYVRSTSELYRPLTACCDRIFPALGRWVPDALQSARTRAGGRPNSDGSHE